MRGKPLKHEIHQTGAGKGVKMAKVTLMSHITHLAIPSERILYCFITSTLKRKIKKMNNDSRRPTVHPAPQVKKPYSFSI